MSLLEPTVPNPERLSFTTPLGIRFWDVAAQAPADGLRVTATDSNGRVTLAIENRVAVYVFSSLPGVRRTGALDDFFASPPATRQFVINVSDPARRFIPVRFHATAPFQGLFQLSLGTSSPPSSLEDLPSGFVPLFSTTSRPPPAKRAVIYAELREAARDRPAAGALLEIEDISGSSALRAFGLADHQGKVAVIFPYPEAPDPGPGSPPPGARRLSDITWSLAVRVFYEPATSPSASITTGDDLPAGLDDLLAQRAGTLLTELSPPSVLSSATLAFGEPLVLPPLESPPRQDRRLFVQPFA